MWPLRILVYLVVEIAKMCSSEIHMFRSPCLSLLSNDIDLLAVFTCLTYWLIFGCPAQYQLKNNSSIRESCCIVEFAPLGDDIHLFMSVTFFAYVASWICSPCWTNSMTHVKHRSSCFFLSWARMALSPVTPHSTGYHLAVSPRYLLPLVSHT
jgi:hypothetical protein